MKHAFLIMAHSQFLSLKELVSALDDARNDIYIHFDEKVKLLPDISTQFSKLVILDRRVNVIWGDISQIKAEYALFEAAFQVGTYSYYHLISGTHFPLKSNDALHSWFDGHEGACILREVPLSEEEIHMRFGLYHFFLKHLVSKNRFVNKAYHLGWRAILWLQKMVGINRDTSFIKGKASQWCSLNEDAVRLLLAKKKDALVKFRRSFCCDEFFVRSVLEGSGIQLIYDDNICYVDFVNTTPKVFSEGDYVTLTTSDALFFRKISDAKISLPRMIKEHIKT